MEILGAYAAAAGTSAQAVREILECVTCDDAVRLLQEEKQTQRLWQGSLKRYDLIWNTGQHLWKQAC